MKPKTAILFALAATAPSLAVAAGVAFAATKTITVQLHILPNGDAHYRYHGEQISSREYIRLSDEAAKQHQEIELRVTMDKPAKGSFIDKILEDAKRNGATHVGFTGIDPHSEPKSAPRTHTISPSQAATPQ